MFFSLCLFLVFISCPQTAFKRKDILLSVFLQAGQHSQSLSRSVWHTASHTMPYVHQSYACSFPWILLPQKISNAGYFVS